MYNEYTMNKNSISPDSPHSRLQVRPAPPTEPTARTGRASLPIAGTRPSFIAVPPSYQAHTLAPLVVFLHGAGGSAEYGLNLLQPLADAAGLIVLAPSSYGRTWDVIEGGYGPDVRLIDEALDYTFARYAVDPAHLAIGGFSDGASYALSLGLTNGDLFSHILAFSPGFLAPSRPTGAPSIYIAHGTHDAVLPIERCSRRIAPRLKRDGYNVRYDEFDGGHTVPEAISLAALRWFAGAEHTP